MYTEIDDDITNTSKLLGTLLMLGSIVEVVDERIQPDNVVLLTTSRVFSFESKKFWLD